MTVILENSKGDILAKISSPDHGDYLYQDDPDYQFLSLLSNCSYDVFGQDDMGSLISELDALKDRLSDEAHRSHVEAIAELAKKCKELPGATLTFTPFE